ncbi:MAG: hypothetical protein JXB04_10015 [Kiritimatiellae bacterium]|nr:hypothetical protein [Kiritimatiellia bacterium]
MKLSSGKIPALLGFLLLTALYVADFHLDVRGRDAFTWMDPCQYFGFAVDVLTGARPFNQFELPSLFPFFVALPLGIQASIPAALFVNILFLVPFLFAVHWLCRRLAPGQPSPLAAACVLASPLLVGLSRSLYVEFSLSAMVALQFLLWLKSERFTRGPETAAFGALFCLGCMMKMTYPLYFAGPFLVEAVLLLRERGRAPLTRMILVFLLSGALAAATQFLVFRKSFVYYLRFGYTSLPIMRLIGPLGIVSPESIGYYFGQVWLTMLFLLAPLLLVPAWIAVKDRRFRAEREVLLVAAWFLAPLVLLIFQEVKEPRHVAPCVLPGVLLVFAGLARLPGRACARALAGAALVLAAGQYLLVTTHRAPTPYFLDRPSAIDEIVNGMIVNDPQQELYRDAGGNRDILRWKYTKNFALTGFDPNMALLMAWHLNPGVAYDLDLLEKPPRRRSRVAFDSFEDLYFINAFNLYNRRCLWNRLYDTLDRETVMAHADYIIARGPGSDELARLYPRFHQVLAVPAGGDTVRVLAAAAPSETSYRALYADAYLERGRPDDAEFAAIYEDLCMNAALRGDLDRLEALEAEFGSKRRPGIERKSIYYAANIIALREAAAAIRRRHE